MLIKLPVELLTVFCEACQSKFAMLSILEGLDDDDNPTIQIWSIGNENCYCPSCGKKGLREVR